MNVPRRMGAAAVVAMAAAAVAVACAGVVAATLGASMPEGLGGALSAAGDVLSWARVLAVAVLGVGVLRARED